MNVKLLLPLFLVLTIFAGAVLFTKLNPQTITHDLIPFPTSNPQPPTSNNTSTPEVIASNLDVPWALAFLPASPAGGPDGSILVTERAGKIKLIKDGSVTTVGEIDVETQSESGLHGIAVDPLFGQDSPLYPENKHYIYVYYTYASQNNQTLNRVSRFKFSNNKISNEKVLIDQIPAAAIHDGGRIKFGPDKFLYTTTGDAANPSLAQDKNSLAGKILRTTFEGNALPNNPLGFAYSMGHRNPQGITWDDKGNLWEVEHGQSATDEINLIRAGENYGWPTLRGNQTGDGMIPPAWHSGTDTWAPGGVAYYNGSLFFGGLRGQALFEAKLQGDKVVSVEKHFDGEFGRIRDVVLGPDNMLYITTSNKDGRGNPKEGDDKIIRVNPSQL